MIALFVDVLKSSVCFHVWMVRIVSKIKCDIQKVDDLLICLDGDS